MQGNESTVHSYQSNHELINNFLEQQKQEVNQFKSVVLDEVTKLISEFVVQREVKITSVLNDSNQNFNSYLSDITNLKKPLSDTITSMKDNSHNFNTKSIETNAVLSQSIEEHSKTIKNFHGSSINSLHRMNSDTVKILGSMDQDSSLFLDDMDTLEKSNQESLLQNRKDHEKILEMTNICSEHTNLKNLGIKTNASLEEDTKYWNSLLEDSSKKDKIFLSTHTQNTSKLNEKINALSIKEYSPTGLTPQKKPPMKIPEIIKPMSNEDILQPFRNKEKLYPHVDPLQNADRQATEILKKVNPKKI